MSQFQLEYFVKHFLPNMKQNNWVRAFELNEKTNKETTLLFELTWILKLPQLVEPLQVLAQTDIVGAVHCVFLNEVNCAAISSKIDCSDAKQSKMKMKKEIILIEKEKCNWIQIKPEFII